MKIKMYDLNTQIKFGRFSGKTITEIIEIEPTYIEWCIKHLDHFLISVEVLNSITEKYSTFKFSSELDEIIDSKKESWQMQNYKEIDDRPSYGYYSGTYAQDVEGLSDDFINDVLDGNPDAYWNID